MRIDHLEVTLCHRQIDRLANGTAGMVKTGMHIDEFHEIAEIIHRGITALTLKITNKWRAIDRRKHRPYCRQSLQNGQNCAHAG